MDDEVNSWIRRTKFSHTVCHRLDSARLTSIPISTIQSGRIAGAKTRPGTGSLNSRPVPTVAPLQRNPTTNKQRTVSPHPETPVPDTFKEARSNQKRFSTPRPRRKEYEKKIVSKSFYKDSRESKSPVLTSPGSRSPSNTSPLRHFTSFKFHDKSSKGRKDSAWSRYFDHGVGRVSSVETADEYTIDLSKLFLGLRFAHGAHSQLYHGKYKDEAVAVKIIRVPDDDEIGALGTRLENQFIREVTLLSRLHHPNIIKVVNRIYFLIWLFHFKYMEL